MIREKYQYSGYGSVEGFGAIPSVATYSARFMKKDYGLSGDFAADPFSSDMMLGVQKQKQLKKEIDSCGGKILSVAGGEVDCSMAVSAVCASKGRFYEAERDKIRRFQRGDYDGEFLIGGNRNRKARGGDDAVDNMLKKLGEKEGGARNENALQQRRASFVLHRAAGRLELFSGDGEPIYSNAFKEGLSEDQSRELLRRMEALHRGQQEESRRWDEERRIREADELRRRTKEEDDEELRRLKERLNKTNTRLDEASHDVKNLDAFLAQLNEMKKKFGQGGAVGDDIYLGDEFMDNEGAIHNMLVHDQARHLPPGAAARKQRLYAALHYGAVVDPEGGEEGTNHRGGKDAHTKCPCCGKNMNDLSDRHNPLRVHLERLQKEVKRQKSIALLIGDSPTLSPEEMHAITSCQKNMRQIREEALQRYKERSTFKIPKTESEMAEYEYRRVKKQIRKTKSRLRADQEEAAAQIKQKTPSSSVGAGGGAEEEEECEVCAVVVDDSNKESDDDRIVGDLNSESSSDDDDDDADVIQRENEVDVAIIELCEKTLFHVTNTGTLKTLELTDDARSTYQRYQEISTGAVSSAPSSSAHNDGGGVGGEGGSKATGAMLTIHQQRRLQQSLDEDENTTIGGDYSSSPPPKTIRGGAPSTMSSVRASTGGAIIVAAPPASGNNKKSTMMIEDGSSDEHAPPPTHTTPTLSNGDEDNASGGATATAASSQTTRATMLVSRARDLLKPSSSTTNNQRKVNQHRRDGGGNDELSPPPPVVAPKHIQPLLSLRSTQGNDGDPPPTYSRPIRTLAASGVDNVAAINKPSRSVAFADDDLIKKRIKIGVTSTAAPEVNLTTAPPSPTPQPSSLDVAQPASLLLGGGGGDIIPSCRNGGGGVRRDGGPLSSKPRKGAGVVINIGGMRRK